MIVDASQNHTGLNIMLLYALRHLPTGMLLSISVRGNGDDADFCNDTSVEFELASGDDIIWTTPSIKDALAALVEDTPWYNSTTSSPQNPFAGELELVELVY